ncbi:MAG: PIN domain-containing protein, partial [Chloroflexi bacterium]|nr:PIN domain-containing protein [Chloroflexota bacterium]
MYLLDTDILSNLLKRAPSITLITRLASKPPEELFTASITLGELIYGAHRLQARGKALLEEIEKPLLPNLLVLPFDALAARRYGEARAELERHGLPLDEPDLRIGAIAL